MMPGRKGDTNSGLMHGSVVGRGLCQRTVVQDLQVWLEQNPASPGFSLASSDTEEE